MITSPSSTGSVPRSCMRRSSLALLRPVGESSVNIAQNDIPIVQPFQKLHTLNRLQLAVWSLPFQQLAYGAGQLGTTQTGVARDYLLY